jgi:hypothetical protein
MNLKKIIKEELEDDWSWVRNMDFFVSPTQLNPNDRYKIASLEGQALKDYMNDSDLSEVDPYNTIFKMDSTGCFEDDNSNFYTDYVDGVGIYQLWVMAEDNPNDVHGWVNIDGLTVIKIL